jgi:hypothetical protein
MARSRKSVVAKAADIEGTPSVSAVAVSAVSCLAVGEAMIGNGVRTVPGQWYEVDGETAAHWHSRGVLWSQAQIDALWQSAGRILTPDGVPTRYEAATPERGAVRVLQLTHYDPGCAVYRYHSAANTVPGVVSAFARIGHSNPACDLRQWDIADQQDVVAMLYRTADVVHCHMDWTIPAGELGGIDAGRKVAITYHGSIEPNRPAITYPEADARMNATVFGARPYHRRFEAHWLPIPMPVDDYAALAKGRKRGKTFRVAHSPTRREIKGTNVFLEVVAQLQAEGVAIDAVLIEGLSHGDALTLKATCDATFDSFWLGMQGSGLEAAAMGQAVIAGTADADYHRVGLDCPWTIASDADTLRDVLRRLVADKAFYAQESARVGQYVRQYHDYPVVGARYRDLLTGPR